MKIAVLAGDGIGPEVTNEAVGILRAVADFGGYDFQFAPALIGGAAINATDSPLPSATLDIVLDSDAVLLGAVGGNDVITDVGHPKPAAGIIEDDPVV